MFFSDAVLYMRYLGCKNKLIKNIENIILKYNYSGEIFADLFAGTSAVGDNFKDKYKIISNDFMYYSYIIANAKLKFKNRPLFNNFYDKFKCDVFEWLNEKIDFSIKSNFIYQNYTPIGGRMFFTEETGLRIDAIRLNIEDLYIKNYIDINEYNYLLASLIDSVSSIANISGTFEAYFKFWDSRTSKRFTIEPLVINETEILKDSFIYNEDTNVLVKKIKGDIAYIDTPYTVTQYASAYHLLETIARYDNPIIAGIGGKRSKGKNVSLYSKKREALYAFEDLIRQINFKYIIISYSNQGLISIDDLVNLCKRFAIKGEVNIDYIEYNEYQNHRSSKKRNGTILKEVLISFEKELIINKSPLNYSGSKDTIFSKIHNALPKHVDTFVDVMGGAFNVGANIIANEKVIYNEKNPYVYNLIKELCSTDKELIVNRIETIIKNYNMQKGNKISYCRLRADFNKDKDIYKLFVLHMYSFQNILRFNFNDEFNTPCGVAGYSDEMKSRIMNFRVKTKMYELLNMDYKDIDYFSFDKDTLFYFDPPYYITNAAYNDGKRGNDSYWNIDEEESLLKKLLFLHQNGYKFILSNVIEHKGKKHQLLIDWVDEHNFEIVEIGISGWRYEKKEVLIRNYKEGD